MTLWDACGNRLLVVLEQADDARLLGANGTAARCFHGRERVADGVAWFAPRDGFHRMAFFNPDGTDERLCGNGLLIAAAVLGGESGALLHPFDHPPVQVRHVDGRVEANARVPLSRRASSAGPIFDTGSPHLVLEHNGPDGLDLAPFARPLVDSLDANVTLYRLDGDVATVRTFERGVNAETLACGTGALAVAFALERPVEVRYPGGTYRAHAERQGAHVRWTLSTAADGVRPA